MPGTLHLQRILAAPPERVWRALTTPDALVKWMAPHGFTATVHEWAEQVGDAYRMSFTNLGTGSSHAFGGALQAADSPRLLRFTDKFEDPGLPGEISLTYELRECVGGTEITVTQEGLPDEIPVEMATRGWQESLELLRLLVEPDIPDGA